MSPTPDDHLNQARRNLDLAEYLLRAHGADTTFVPWAVTAVFYCAVHCIQAHLLRNGRSPRTHQMRGSLIADPRYGVPMDVQTAYELLSQRSRAARYALAHFDPAIVKRRLIDHYLAKITTYAGL